MIRHGDLSHDGFFFYPERHLKLDNTGLAPDVAARRIAEAFDIPIMT